MVLEEVDVVQDNGDHCCTLWDDCATLFWIVQGALFNGNVVCATTKLSLIYYVSTSTQLQVLLAYNKSAKIWFSLIPIECKGYVNT